MVTTLQVFHVEYLIGTFWLAEVLGWSAAWNSVCVGHWQPGTPQSLLGIGSPDPCLRWVKWQWDWEPVRSKQAVKRFTCMWTTFVEHSCWTTLCCLSQESYSVCAVFVVCFCQSMEAMCIAYNTTSWHMICIYVCANNSWQCILVLSLCPVQEVDNLQHVSEFHPDRLFL